MMRRFFRRSRQLYGDPFFLQGFQSLPILMLLLSLAATYGAWQSAYHNVERDLQIDFAFRVRETVQRIEQRMNAYEQVLRGARSLFLASEKVSRHEFGDYVAGLKLDQHYPGIQGVGYAIIVAPEQKDRHIEDVRRQGFPHYKIWPESEREVYTSILYLEPFADRNLRAFGYDMHSEPVRRAAMERARDTGKVAMSGKVILVQETDKEIQAGFLIYLPLYEKGLPHETLEELHTHIIGWVYSPFRMNDFMAGIGGERSGDLNLEIYDGETLSEDSRLYGHTVTVPVDCLALHSVTRLDIAGHVWTVAVQALPAFSRRFDRNEPLLIGGAGIVLSLLFALITWLLTSGRRRALALAQKMTCELAESEQRFRLMADSAPVLIWLAGTDQQRSFFNKIWLDFTGRSLQQEAGDGWSLGVHPDDLPHYRAIYSQHFEKREPFRVEYRLRRHDNRYRWLLDSGVPRLDGNGHFEGYIGSCVDITEHKLIQSAVESSNADLTRFAEVSAHHLMEPSRRLISYTQLVRTHLVNFPEALENEAIRSSLDYLERDTVRLRNLVRDIQLFLAAGEARGEIKREDADAAFATVVHRLETRIKALDARVVTKPLPPVLIDRPRLINLLTILMDNALNHGCPLDTSERLHIRMDGEKIDGGFSRYRLSDNGPGIPSSYCLRVFEIFERFNTGDHKGTGIGLAIARRIVESCHGKIWLENLPQGGISVVFELPNGE